MARRAPHTLREWDAILTERRERRWAMILACVAHGDTDGEIAERLNYTKNTVKWTLKEIYLELGARNRAHAVALAIHRGLLRLEDRAA